MKNYKFLGCAKLGEIPQTFASQYMGHRKSYASQELKLLNEFLVWDQICILEYSQYYDMVYFENGPHCKIG